MGGVNRLRDNSISPRKQARQSSPQWRAYLPLCGPWHSDCRAPHLSRMANRRGCTSRRLSLAFQPCCHIVTEQMALLFCAVQPAYSLNATPTCLRSRSAQLGSARLAGGSSGPPTAAMATGTGTPDFAHWRSQTGIPPTAKVARASALACYLSPEQTAARPARATSLRSTVCCCCCCGGVSSPSIAPSRRLRTVPHKNLPRAPCCRLSFASIRGMGLAQCYGCHHSPHSDCAFRERRNGSKEGQRLLRQEEAAYSRQEAAKKHASFCRRMRQTAFVPTRSGRGN